jgi:hypothetical protein
MTAASTYRVLALLDVLLRRAALVVEGDNAFGRPRQVGDDEADARVPLSLQIVGRCFDEATLLRIGYAYERATSWRDRRPPVR